MSDRMQFINVTLPPDRVAKLDADVQKAHSMPFEDLSRAEPHAAYEILAGIALTTAGAEVRVTVNNEPISVAADPSDPNRIMTRSKTEVLPDPEYTPLHVIVSFWKKPTLVEKIRRKKYDSQVSTVFHTRPNDYA